MLQTYSQIFKEWKDEAGVKDTILIRNCYKALHQLKCNVVIYPEARFSLAGINEDIGKALGKFAKVCKVPVVVMNQKGTFLRSPQWCKHPYRKIQCELDYIQVVTKEEVLTLSAEEIQERIEDAFIWDDYKWQYDNKIKIKDKDRATNIHKILYKCPCCGAEEKTTSYQYRYPHSYIDNLLFFLLVLMLLDFLRM